MPFTPFGPFLDRATCIVERRIKRAFLRAARACVRVSCAGPGLRAPKQLDSGWQPVNAHSHDWVVTELNWTERRNTRPFTQRLDMVGCVGTVQADGERGWCWLCLHALNPPAACSAGTHRLHPTPPNHPLPWPPPERVSLCALARSWGGQSVAGRASRWFHNRPRMVDGRHPAACQAGACVDLSERTVMRPRRAGHRPETPPAPGCAGGAHTARSARLSDAPSHFSCMSVACN